MPTPACALVLLAYQGFHSAEIALEIDDRLDSCAIADLDPARAGNEIVVSTSRGPVLVLHREGETWRHELAFDAPGEMIQVAAGDALPARAGDEIVAVGKLEGSEDSPGNGAAYVVWRGEHGWQSRQVFEGPALVHGVAIGTDGIWVTGFDQQIHLLRVRGEEVERVASASLPGHGKNALAFPGGAVVACTDGSVVEARLSEGELALTVLDKRETGCATPAWSNPEGEPNTWARPGILALTKVPSGSDHATLAPVERGAVPRFLGRSPGLDRCTAGSTDEPRAGDAPCRGTRPRACFRASDAHLRSSSCGHGLTPATGIRGRGCASERVSEDDTHLEGVRVPELDVGAEQCAHVGADVEVLAERPVGAAAHVQSEGSVIVRPNTGGLGLGLDPRESAAQEGMELAGNGPGLPRPGVDLQDRGLELPCAHGRLVRGARDADLPSDRVVRVVAVELQAPADLVAAGSASSTTRPIRISETL